MTPEILLREIHGINAKYELLNRATGRDFNIFDLIGISSREITICRILYELFSPQGCHYQGILFLRSFFDRVLHLPDVSDNELQQAYIYREYVIDEQRRINLVIETKHYFIPIEVKIYAGEQEHQCLDYVRFAQRKQKDAKLYYLTRFGDNPSSYSADGLTVETEGYREIVCISFAYDLIEWLENCLTQVWKIAPIREILS